MVPRILVVMTGVKSSSDGEMRRADQGSTISVGTRDDERFVGVERCCVSGSVGRRCVTNKRDLEGGIDLGKIPRE